VPSFTIHTLRSSVVIFTQRLRGKYVRAVQRGQITVAKGLRIGGSFVVFVLVILAAPAGERAQDFPEVLGDSVPDSGQATPSVFSPLVSARKPLRLPDSRPAPATSADSVVVLDVTSGAILYEMNANTPLPPASLTKIMTALIALENYELDEVVTVPPDCVDLSGNNMGLLSGEQLSVEDLLYGLLLYSSSDAACALSFHNGLSGGLFVKKMNEKAQALGLSSINFVNVTGLDDLNHRASAYDIAKLSLEAMENQEYGKIFRKIVGTPQATVFSQGGLSHQLVNTNSLLGSMPGVTGVKTGYTEEAGGCLSLSVFRGGYELLVVVMGSEGMEARFEDAKELVSWAFSAHVWE